MERFYLKSCRLNATLQHSTFGNNTERSGTIAFPCERGPICNTAFRCTFPLSRHVNSGGRGGITPLQCLENAIAVGKSISALRSCLLDEASFLGELAMLGQLVLAGKPNITLRIC